jgi:hypothetical protein
MAFRNLHLQGVVYSLRDKESRTLLHSDNLILNNVKFVVQKGGQDRVRKTGKKTVHAGPRGTLVVDPVHLSNILPKLKQSAETVYYNPYKTDFFVDTDGKTVVGADFVWLTSEAGRSKVVILGKKLAT